MVTFVAPESAVGFPAQACVVTRYHAGMTLTQRDRPKPTAAKSGADGIDWVRVEAALAADGFAIVPGLLTRAQCEAVRGMYGDDGAFRSTVVMARHGFGRGEYRYFSYPLPDLVAGLRAALYPPLARIANGWAGMLGEARQFPEAHADFIAECRAVGQMRPTPLLLRYGPGDFNCLHQDLYGEHLFPLQVAVLLSEPEEEFEGGEFVMVEQRPRRQSKASVAPLRQGDAVIFAVNQRPVMGGRGSYRTAMRHGVSVVRAGERFALGVIFHDAT
jgi:hypothetical protein